MNGNYDPIFGWYWVNYQLTSKDTLAVYLECKFDMMADQECQLIEESMKAKAKQGVYFRKLCILRTVTFPIDLIGSLFLLGTVGAVKRWALQRVLWKFIFKRATQEELINAIQESG